MSCNAVDIATVVAEVMKQLASQNAGEGVPAVASGMLAGAGVEGVVVDKPVESPTDSAVEVGVEVVDTSSEGSVEMPREGPSVDGRVSTLAFGEADVGGPPVGGFFRDVVKAERVRSLKRMLRERAGVVLPRSAWYDLALASYAAGSVPTGFLRGQEHLRALAAVGDVALAMALVLKEYGRGRSVSSAQELRSRDLSNSRMSRAFVDSGLVNFVAIPAGIDAGTAKTGADAVEALAGVIYIHCGAAAVASYSRWLRLS